MNTLKAKTKKQPPIRPPQFNPQGRYGPDSVINKDKRRRGNFAREGKPWTDSEHDQLLECFLVKELGKYSPVGKPSIMSVLQRSLDSIETKLRKIGPRIDKATRKWVSDPKNRTDRTGLPLSDRDLFLLSHMLGERGREEGACEPVYIGMVLGRSVESIWAYLEEKKQRVLAKQLIKAQPKVGESEDRFTARIVGPLLGSIKELREMWEKDHEST